MQNKPNFQDVQMNVNQYNKKKYENFINPISEMAKMNVNLTLIKDYRKNDFSQPKKRTQTNPISNRPFLLLK